MATVTVASLHYRSMTASSFIRFLIFTLGLLGAFLLSACQGSKSERAKLEGSHETTSMFGDKVVIHAIPLTFEDPSTRILLTSSSARTQAHFQRGLPRAMGSGLVLKPSPAGTLSFWVLSDRGPNADGPKVQGVDSKLFPLPDYAPLMGTLTLTGHDGTLSDLYPLHIKDRLLSGLPHPEGSLGATHEVPLNDRLHRLKSDPDGADPEAITFDGKDLWIAEEYGPSLFRVNPQTGQVLDLFRPGQGLPEILSHRRNNRGFEALAYDPDRKTLNAVLQSNLDEDAPFIRWLEWDPSKGLQREYAYPLSPADYKKDNPGEAKLGDMAALGQGLFVVIEEGKDAEGRDRHRLMLVDLNRASDIHGMEGLESLSGDPERVSAYQAIQPLSTVRLLDLEQAGWTLEKAEGLALINEKTLALTNDNDFGLESSLIDNEGKILKGHRHACSLEEDSGSERPTLSGKKCPKNAQDIELVPSSKAAAEQVVWTLTFERPLREYFNKPLTP